MHPQYSNGYDPDPTAAALSEQEAVRAAEELLAGLRLPGKLRRSADVRAMLSYARTSKSIQTSIPDQHAAIDRMAHRIEVPVTQQRQDKGKSGWSRDRAGYRAVLEDLATAQYSHVGLYKADRLARDSELLIGFVHACWRMGITVMDSTIGEITPLNLRVLAMLAEMELRQNSERSTNGLEQKAKDRKLGAAPAGYKHAGECQVLEDGRKVWTQKGQWVPDEDGLAPAIRELGRRFADGESLAALTRWFNERTGSRRCVSNIKRTLSNEFYAGWVVNRKWSDSILNGGRHVRPKEEWTKPWRHPYPLWDEDTWHRIQARLQLTRNVGQQRRAGAHYALQGIIWCAQCGRRMCGHAEADRRRAYRCPSCCIDRGLLKVERAVRKCLEQIALTSQQAADVQAELGDDRAALEREISGLAKQRKELHERRRRAYRRLDQGIIDEQQYRDEVADVDQALELVSARESELQATIAALPGQDALLAQIVASQDEWLRWPQKIVHMTLEGQQRVYRECCARVVVDPVRNNLT